MLFQIIVVPDHRAAEGLNSAHAWLDFITAARRAHRLREVNAIGYHKTINPP
jgi:hypothetical protein